jgi:hypothetical protein
MVMRTLIVPSSVVVVARTYRRPARPAGAAAFGRVTAMSPDLLLTPLAVAASPGTGVLRAGAARCVREAEQQAAVAGRG